MSIDNLVLWMDRLETMKCISHYHRLPHRIEVKASSCTKVEDLFKQHLRALHCHGAVEVAYRWTDSSVVMKGYPIKKA